jgi:hypothetical protein
MMGRRSRIVAVVVIVVGLAAVAAYTYDSSQKGKIAEGVAVAGLDVGGMSTGEAESALRRQLVAPRRHSLTVTYQGRSWSLSAGQLKVRVDVSRAVRRAVAAGQGGGLPGRLVREVTGGEVDDSIAADVEYSHPAINAFVRRIAADLDREPVDASVEPGADSLKIVAAKPGRKLRDNRLTSELEGAVERGGGDAVAAVVHGTAPEVTAGELGSRYPSYLTLDRATFTLRLWKDLKPAETFTVAVGREGLETPEGLYAIEVMEENPVWHVPESAWAGALAGKTIQPGPADPIKARWMGFYEGAGIHGTEEVESLGSAASHGCVRMSIADVKRLYDQVEVGTPIYVG